MVDKHPDCWNKTISQFLIGNAASEKVLPQHLEHHDFDFGLELNSAYFLAPGLLVGTKRLESFRNRLAEGLLKAMKLFRLKQIGPTEWFAGELFLPAPRPAIRIQQRIHTGRTSDSRHRTLIPVKLTGLVAGCAKDCLNNGWLAG